MMRFLTSLLSITLLSSSIVVGQGLFDLRTDLYPTRVSSGSPLAVVDVNGDHLDDIVHLENGRKLYVNYQDPESGDFIRSEVLHSYREAQWSVVVADFDRNGWRDILVGGAYENFFVYFQDNGVFTKDTLDGREIYAQATNAIDINNDGWTDIFMCNDVGRNIIWWNREGELERDTTELFFDLSPSNSAGNYGSEWSDVDNDGDMDLYIAKCHAQAALPSDLRRINRLYINQGDGSFKEEAGARGVASGAQSWTGHFYDADNDGDQDLLVSNHDQIAELFINDGMGFFEDATMRSRLRIGGPVIQCMALDANGDGWQDIAVGGVPDYLYQYRPSGVYQQLTDELGPYDITSYAIGDLNNDNVADMYATVGNLIQLPSSIQDRCLFGTSSGDNTLSVHLKGEESNPDGIGARIDVFYEEAVQSKVVKAGESYGVQNSFKHLFHTIQKPDSIRITWPDGSSQVKRDVSSNDDLMFWQGHFIFSASEEGLVKRVDLCEGDSVVFKLSENLGTIEWSNGRTGNELTATEEGFYQATVCDNDGECLTLPGILVTLDVLPSGQVTYLQGEETVCDGEVVEINVEVMDALSWTWRDTGAEGARLISESGIYSAVLNGKCGSSQIDVEVDVIDPAFDQIRNDTVDRSQTTGVLEAVYDEGWTEWYDDAQGVKFLGSGDRWVVEDVEKDTTVFAQPVFEQIMDTLVWGETSLIGADKRPNTLENASMFFEVHSSSVLVSVDVYSLKPGSRRILLLDRDLKRVDSVDMLLDTGWHTIDLGFELLPQMGPYRLTTDDKVNISQFQHRWPALTTNYEEVKYPYSIPEIGYLKQSLYGYDRYDYFYNWKMVRNRRRCEGQVLPLTVVVRTSTSNTNHTGPSSFKVYPNPNVGAFTVDWKEKAVDANIQVFNSLGHPVPFTIESTNRMMRVRLDGVLEGGVYYLKISGQVKALVVQR